MKKAKRRYGAHTKAERLRRQLDLKAVKEQYGITWQRMADLTGLSCVVLRHYSCGAKPIPSRTLSFIVLKLADHARTAAPKEPYFNVPF